MEERIRVDITKLTDDTRKFLNLLDPQSMTRFIDKYFSEDAEDVDINALVREMLEGL